MDVDSGVFHNNRSLRMSWVCTSIHLNRMFLKQQKRQRGEKSGPCGFYACRLSSFAVNGKQLYETYHRRRWDYQLFLCTAQPLQSHIHLPCSGVWRSGSVRHLKRQSLKKIALVLRYFISIFICIVLSLFVPVKMKSRLAEDSSFTAVHSVHSNDQNSTL